MSYMDHEKGKKCLLEISDILDELSLPFFLIQGTALGAYRDKGFTPTEQDIDFGLLQENLTPNKALEMLSLLLRRGFDVECFVMPFKHPRTLVAFKDGAKADIVAFTRYKGWRFAATPVRPWIPDQYALVFEAQMMEQYDDLELFGRKFLVPSPIELYLECEYGDDWRTPREDHVSRARIYDFLTREGIEHGC